MKSATINGFLLVAVLGAATNVQGQNLRQSAPRLRIFNGKDPSTFQVAGQNPIADKLFYDIANNPDAPIEEEGQAIDEEAAAEQEAFQALLESLSKVGARSMPPTDTPSVAATSTPIQTEIPTIDPSDAPSASPTVSAKPTDGPTFLPTLPAGQTAVPTTLVPTSTPTTLAPTELPSETPTLSVQPSDVPSFVPTFRPTTNAPSAQPTLLKCGISEQTRIDRLVAVLEEAVADSSVLFIPDAPQGLATEWILNQDEALLCPDDPKFLQRWVLAVIYFSTNGDDWILCSANPAAVDDCGNVLPLVGATRFLGGNSECEWAGISCIDGCVTEIEFEENNLVGTIPTEIGLLSDLAVWGMERGGLVSTIPTEVGLLTNLIFLDLDFNALTGSLPDELFTLTDLTQLDVNDNQLTGSINNIGVFAAMEFLQLHDNDFTGTVPTQVGTFTNLAAFTLHETLISGTMPEEVCELFNPAKGILSIMIADCDGTPPNIECECCTDCRD